jgi:hypothetical protein
MALRKSKEKRGMSAKRASPDRQARPERRERRVRKVRRETQGLPARRSESCPHKSSIASCNGDEIMISAYCTGTFNAYPLVPLANGARCGNNPTLALRVTIVCAKR